MGKWADGKNEVKMGKLSWNTIYTDFKSRHPRLSKMVTYWCPYNFATIMIYFSDGRKATYNYLEHKAIFTTDRWIRDENNT